VDPLVRQLLDDIAAGMTAHELERDDVDFKEDDRSDRTVKLLVDACLCFANASGGTIVLGVANAVRGPAAFTGTDLDPDFVKRRIYELTVPGLLVEVEEAVASGRRLLVIRVTEAVEIHADTQGRAPRRVGSDCRPMTPAQQAQLRQDRRTATPARRQRGSSWRTRAEPRPSRCQASTTSTARSASCGASR